MADVFLSYSRPDQAIAELLADRLGEAGLSVWWDRHIHGGADFATEIEREIQAARVVVVVWSSSAVPSKWVRDEAAYARDNNKLVPVRIDATPPPFGFRQLQAIDFSQWQGATDDRCFQSLRHSTDRVLQGIPLEEAADQPASPSGASASAQRAEAKRSPTPSRRNLRTLAIGAVVVLAAALGVMTYLGHGLPLGAPEIARDEVELRPFTAVPADAERTIRASGYTDTFRSRLTAMGVRNVTAAPGVEPRSEFVMVGELSRDGDKDILATRVFDRATGSTVWTNRGEPTKNAIWEANLAGYSISCGLKRRDPARGPELLSRYLLGCSSFLARDIPAFESAAKAAYKAASDDPRAIAFYAVGTAANAYLQANSKPEYARMMAEVSKLADEALRIDPGNADAMFAKGMSFVDPQFQQQEEWWRKSIEADLDTGMAYGRYGNFLAMVGRVREAMDMQARAVQDRPSTLGTNAARLFAAAGDWYQADQVYTMIRDFNPDLIGRSEMQTYVMYGDLATATRLFTERAASLPPERQACIRLVLDARRGLPYDATKFAAACGGAYDSPNLFALAGDVDGAFRQAEQFMRENELSEPLKFFGPEMRELRKDPRFWPLMARIGLTRYWLDTNQWPDFCAAEKVDCRVAAAAAQAALDASNSKQAFGK